MSVMPSIDIKANVTACHCKFNFSKEAKTKLA